MFVAGASVLIIEIAGTGIISPFFGNTIYVWASLISVTMASLAAGYFIGGRICEKYPYEKVFYALVMSAAFAVIIAALTAPFILRLTDRIGNRLGAFLSAVFIFTIPLVILGMLSPFGVKLLDIKIKKAGLSSGLVYGFGTMGSFLGAVAAGFFLIPFFGIRFTLFAVALTLSLFSSFWYLFYQAKKIWIVLPATVLVLAFLPSGGSGYNQNEEVLFEKRSLYSKLQVTRYKTGYKGLKSDNVLQTVFNEAKGEFNNGYIQLFAEAGKMRQNGSALSIGLGAGASDRVLRKYGIKVTNVEIDPEVEKIAREHFGFDGKCVISDGRYFIRNTDERYDIIYIDVFSGFAFGKYMLTLEAFKEAKRALKDKGMLVINVIGRYAGDGMPVNEKLVKSVYSTLKRVYDNVNVATDGNERLTANYIFFASDSSNIPDGNISSGLTEVFEIITDDRNTVEEMSADIIRVWRQEAVKYIGEFSADVL